MSPADILVQPTKRAHRRIFEVLQIEERGWGSHFAEELKGKDLVVDAVGKKGKKVPLVFQLHRVSPAAAFPLEAHLLRGDLARQQRSDRKLEPVLVLSVQSLTERLGNEVLTFIKDKCRDQHALIVSDRGGLVAWLPLLGMETVRADAARIRKSGDLKVSTSKGGAVFSDKDQWLMKHLIYANAPDPTWWGQASQKITSTAQWIQQARTGTTTVYRLRDRLLNRGVLDGSQHGLIRLIGPGRLLEDWMSQARLEFPESVAVVPVYEAGKERASFERRLYWLQKNIGHRPRDEYAMSGWCAVRRHEMAHVVANDDRAMEITVRGDLVQTCVDWKLTTCHPKDAWYTLSATKTPSSVFLSSVKFDHLWVVDLWQSALDVAHDPARGMEQAEFIAAAIAETLQ